jgi:hypothetical protein
MGRKKDYGPKEAGQQFEEIEKAQRKLGRNVIRNTEKSRARDKSELKELGRDVLKRRRSRRQQTGD